MKRQSVIVWLAVVVAAVLVVCLLRFHGTATVHSKAPVQTTSSAIAGAASAPGQSPAARIAKVYLVRPDQVLAMVNGTPITLRDLIPLQAGNNEPQQLDPAAYNYFLQRAINRKLITQAAKTHGIVLNDSQQQQLDKLKAEREQPYPGQVRQISVNPTEIEFDLQDEQAFMLQTSLMAAAGLTPNVTPDQVEQYYQQHISEFGVLPSDPLARQQAWQEIDIQIRNQLAASVRADYQQQLDAYMNGLKSRANITMTPLTETLMNPAVGQTSASR